ncbi:GntR family transcriptional regulator [Yoonia sp. SS1-5]|uniref:GntR family transcriptional regulator n=1 Tax=Yoonia rhodophyticola TaxID=3137370 RepID=A0AAN0M7M5_9RHOB
MVFETLHAQILSLELLPGARISEAEVAAKLGVSRQPVRDAFNRLSNLQLLKVRPQRATVVSGFSITEIENTRFVRLAVELEIARLACQNWVPANAQLLKENIAQQRAAIKAGQTQTFHQLDYDFHKLICELGGHPLAFQTIVECKQRVDRLCMLSLASRDEVAAVLVDHESIADALSSGSIEKVETVFRRHLGRLDSVISDIYATHAEFFDN